LLSVDSHLLAPLLLLLLLLLCDIARSSL